MPWLLTTETQAWRPVILQNRDAWKITKKWTTTSLLEWRRFKTWRSIAISYWLSPKNINLNFSNIILQNSQSTVHVHNFSVYLINHHQNFIIHISKFFTKIYQFTMKSDKTPTHQLELLHKFRISWLRWKQNLNNEGELDGVSGDPRENWSSFLNLVDLSEHFEKARTWQLCFLPSKIE